jgi:hypothetical protein
MIPSRCRCPVLIPVIMLISLGLAGATAPSEISFTRFDYDAGGPGIALAAGDVDGDGDVDLAVANWVRQAVSVLRNQGDGTFAAPERYRTREEPLAIVMADVDADGDLDLVIGNFSGSRPVAVLFNRGQGTFDQPVSYRGSTGAPAEAVAVVDVDGDGELDLAVATNSSSSDDVVTVFRNRGGEVRWPRRRFQPAGNYPVAPSGPLSLAAGDLDGDGFPDLVSPIDVAPPGAVLSLLYNQGDGTFAPHVDLPLRNTANDVAIGDLDGDGDQDLAVAIGWQYETPNYDAVSVLLNRGDGIFAAPVDYRVGVGRDPYWPVALALGDLDGDGDLDVVFANYMDPGSVGVLLNQGAGVFASAGEYAVGQGPNDVVVGDFNGDGRPDLAASSWISGTVSVLLNQLPQGTHHAGRAQELRPGDPHLLAPLRDGGRHDRRVGRQPVARVVVLREADPGEPHLRRENTLFQPLLVAPHRDRGVVKARRNRPSGGKPMPLCIPYLRKQRCLHGCPPRPCVLAPVWRRGLTNALRFGLAWIDGWWCTGVAAFPAV